VEGPFDRAGRITAITVVTPVRRWWATWLRIDFVLLKVLKWFLRQREPARAVKRLSFINFGRWAVMDRVPASGSGRGRRLPHPYILFQSNFNGASHEYFEAFARGLKLRMRGLWGGAYGVPDPNDLTKFSRYVHQHWQPTDHYYAAYPQASTKMVLSALALRTEFDAFSRRAADLDADRFAREYAEFVARALRPPGKGRSRRKVPHPADGLAVLIPVVADEVSELRRHLADIPRGHSSPLARVEGTHFARLQLIRLTGPDGKRIEGEPPYLLFSSEHDGPTERYVAHLCATLHYESHEIWEHCDGYPGHETGALEGYLLRHRVKPGYSVVAYPGATVDDVRTSLALQDRINEFVVRTRGFDGEALREAWLQRFRSERR
jgi:hypothetical protein